MRDELRDAFNLLSASFHPSSLIPHPFLSSLIPHPSSLAFILLLLGAGFVIACAVLAAMSRHQKSAGRPLRLEGRVGVVLEALGPEGTVLVDGELWRARAGSHRRCARALVGSRSRRLMFSSSPPPPLSARVFSCHLDGSRPSRTTLKSTLDPVPFFVARDVLNREVASTKEVKS